jgi:L-alanine-DL-glutamate epimerase-like enolase superfamily enzyme
VGFIQVDTGRIGGIDPAKRVAEYAAAKSVTFVNHTFTSHLALSASLRPYAGIRNDHICEYPFAPKPLGRQLIVNHLKRNPQGYVHAPHTPGLGIEINAEAARRYLVDVEIKVRGTRLFTSTDLF